MTNALERRLAQLEAHLPSRRPDGLSAAEAEEMDRQCDEKITQFKQVTARIEADVAADSAATFRHVIDHGTAAEMLVLIEALKFNVPSGVLVGAMILAGDAYAGPLDAWRQKGRAFLQGVVGEGELRGAETLQPDMEETPESLAIRNAKDANEALKLFERYRPRGFIAA